MVEFSVNIYDIYKDGLGESAYAGKIDAAVDNCSSPAAAFACLGAYFAGLEQAEMNSLLKKYEAQHEIYTNCLTQSRFANGQKGVAAGSAKKASWLNAMSGDNPMSVHEYQLYMAGILGDGDEDAGGAKFVAMDKNKDGFFTAGEWENQCDIINKQKDIESTELNKLSTDMELSVQDASEAQEMAANAIKKVTDLASSQAKVSGG